MSHRPRNWSRGVAVVATLTAPLVALVALLGPFAPVASAAQHLHSRAGVAAITEPNGHLVGPSRSILLGAGRERALSYDRSGIPSPAAALTDTPGTVTTSETIALCGYDPAPTAFWRQFKNSVADARKNVPSSSILSTTIGPRAPPIPGVTAAEDGAGSLSRVFWSGSSEAKQAAEEWATSNGGQTLEMTARGQELEASNLEWTEAKPLWEAASADFASGATGDVQVFQAAEGVRLQSMWAQIEYPILSQNPDVNLIFHMVGGG